MNDDKVRVYTDRNPTRLTYVTSKYVGGQVNGVTVGQIRGKEYGEVKMCVGAAGKVNALYKAGAPNNFVPWAYRNYWAY